MEINDLIGKHALGFKFETGNGLLWPNIMYNEIGNKGRIIEIKDIGIKIVKLKFASGYSCWYPIDHPDFKIVDEDALVQGEKLLFSIV
jgi:hypothetical protein